VQQLRTTLGHYSRLLQLLQQQEQQRRREGEAEESDASGSSSEDSDAAEGADDSLFAADEFDADAVLAADSSPTHEAEVEAGQQQQRSGDSAADAGSSDHAGVRWVCAAFEWQQLLTYISKDPRVLLLSPKEIFGRVWVLGAELGHSTFVGSTVSSDSSSGGGSRSVAAALVLGHPSYIAADAGLLFAWASDVRHLTGMTAAQARRLVVCPQVRVGVWLAWRAWVGGCLARPVAAHLVTPRLPDARVLPASDRCFSPSAPRMCSPAWRP
jgi:hypothetical protein